MDGASKTVTRLALELGGNAPILIFPDVDLEAVVEKSVAWKYRNCGQVCVSPQRFFVHSQIVEEFTERVIQKAGQMVIGNGLDPETDVGPLINARQRDRVAHLVDEARQNGAQVLVGGGQPETLSRGYFYQPTVMTNLSPEMPLYQEEIFGPVLPIIPFSDVDNALAMANNTEYGPGPHSCRRMTSIPHCTSLSAWNTAWFVSMTGSPPRPKHPSAGLSKAASDAKPAQRVLREYMEEKTVFIGGLDQW